jgi:hypothetical protein
MLGSSWVAAQLVAPREGLRSMELISFKFFSLYCLSLNEAPLKLKIEFERFLFRNFEIFITI